MSKASIICLPFICKAIVICRFYQALKKVPGERRGRWLLLYKKPVSGLGIQNDWQLVLTSRR